MADKAPNEAAEEAEGAGSGESFLDQFLRRLDQTSDQEAGVSPSTTSSSMAVPTTPGEYSSNNPWSFSSALNSDPQHSLLYAPGYSVAPSPYSANPLAEFPWLLQEFDHPRPGLDSRLTGTTDHKLYSSFPQREQLPLDQSPVQGESKRQESMVTGHGSGSSSSKLDAAPVPRFGSSGHFSDPASAQAQIIGGRAINYRPPTSPLLSEATTVGAGGSVTTSAGTSNTSASSGSTSNAGDGDETEEPEQQQQQLEGETSSGLKRKKPEAGGASGSDAPDPSKKSVDPTKSKPRKRGGAKRLREPRYAIKTRTDVDVLDDGFKWRKYGQKAVKNSPHPRNYYRCTTPMCPVRKRVERSNEDAGLVITTYEGTHTHQTPGFRPAGGYFGDRPLGMGGGLFQSPLGPGGANLLPLPPGFDLASLQQANALRNLRGLQPNPSLPQQHLRQLGLQQDSLLRAQQFLGLQDPAFASVKREPFQFTAQPPDASRFMQNRNLLLHQQPPPGPSNQSLLTRSISDQRPGAALFAGLPGFPISGPASSSNIPRHELEPGSSSRIDQSLQTLVSSSNFEDRSDQPQSPIILASGSLDPRGQQLQRNSRPGSSSENFQGHAAESSTLAQQQQQQQPEGLLQDMVRHGGPKVSKS